MKQKTIHYAGNSEEVTTKYFDSSILNWLPGLRSYSSVTDQSYLWPPLALTLTFTILMSPLLLAK